MACTEELAYKQIKGVGMMAKDRYGVDIKVGEFVRHVFRDICEGMDVRPDPDYVGVVVGIDPNRLPLIDVDCGVEFVRGLPHSELMHCQENGQALSGHKYHPVV